MPKPDPLDPKHAEHDPLGLDPTRYGDWTLKGIAVDFWRADAAFNRRSAPAPR